MKWTWLGMGVMALGLGAGWMAQGEDKPAAPEKDEPAKKSTLRKDEKPVLPGKEGATKKSLLPRGGWNIISNSGNGFGNSINVGGSGGITVIRNSRNGVSNHIGVENHGQRIEITDDGVSINGVRYAGKESKFWTRCKWSDELGCMLFWCPKAKEWLWFDVTTNRYRPVTEPPMDDD